MVECYYYSVALLLVGFKETFSFLCPLKGMLFIFSNCVFFLLRLRQESLWTEVISSHSSMIGHIRYSRSRHPYFFFFKITKSFLYAAHFGTTEKGSERCIVLVFEDVEK